jgi:putative ABC transport system substrate-binding protein
VKRFWIVDFGFSIGSGSKSIFCLAVCAMLLALCVFAEAQQTKKIPRIGYVSGTGNATDQGPYIEALRQGLRDLGYVDGKNIVIEFRGAEESSIVFLIL